jgi:hypothetical protein
MDGELNRGLSFLGLTKDQQDSFSPSSVPVLVRFETGECVYKWTSYSLVNPNNNKITEYWCPWKSLKIGPTEIPGFKELRMRYRNVGGSVGRPQEFARARNAVTEQWNGMDSLMKAEFKKPVWGFAGKISGQRKFRDPEHPAEQCNVFFIGGDFQLCIPNLTVAWIRQL